MVRGETWSCGARLCSSARDHPVAEPATNHWNRVVVGLSLFFFFQAEDGIRDLTVTGVQTCALPISTPPPVPPGVGAVLKAMVTLRSLREPAARNRPPPWASPPPPLAPLGPGLSFSSDRKSVV